jgi:glutamate 5-kinase
MRRIVVKIGSSVIAPKGKLDSGLVASLLEDVLSVEKKGYKTIIVSSGAIACGLEKLGYKKKPQDTYALMAISSLGQILLMDTFNEKFRKYKRMCAQVLLTWDDFDIRRRFMNIRKTIDKLLAMDIIPIINENDAVSYEEIRLGDNDCISARVADLSQAEWLIMLSDVEGLLDGDRLVREVPDIDPRTISLARKEDKTHTSGGMETKLQAAKIAVSSGVKTVIAYGRKKQVLSRIVGGDSVGTYFSPSANPQRARKRWILFSKKIKGRVFIDKGAEEALLHKGKSLLAPGITRIEGIFKSGDAVGVLSDEGALIGYGIVSYDCDALKEARKRRFEREIIHRDDFVKAQEASGGECSSCGIY